MEEIKNSQTNHYLPILAPKDYFLGPVFAATKQTGARIVTIGDKRYEIGGFHPLRRAVFPPALDVRHARVIFSLLSFRKPYDDDAATRLITFSLRELCRRYAHTNGGRYSRDIRQTLGDLTEAYIRVTDAKTGISHSYRLIERLDVEERPIRRRDAKLANDLQSELWFNGCTLSPEFFGLLGRIAELQSMDLDVFTSIRSPLAQSIYLYIPSRADHHSESDPFEITLTRLLEQVSFPVPKEKQRRMRVFTRNEGRSIMHQLDGLATLKGVFRVRLVQTVERDEWKLLAWVEKREGRRPIDPAKSKIAAAYLCSGRPLELMAQSFAAIKPLTDYEQDLLKTANVDLKKNKGFLEQAKALLREPKFDELLAEAKADEQEGRKAIKNPTARLIHRLMRAIETPPTQPKIGKFS